MENTEISGSRPRARSSLFFPYDSNRIDLNKVANHDVKLYAGRFTNRFLGIRKAAPPAFYSARIPVDDGTRGYIRGIISCLVGFVGGKQSARPLQANVLPRNTLHTHLSPVFFRFRMPRYIPLSFPFQSHLSPLCEYPLPPFRRSSYVPPFTSSP